MRTNQPENIHTSTHTFRYKLFLTLHKPYTRSRLIKIALTKKFVQNAILPQPANYTILHKILQNLRQSFFLTHCVTLTENMRLIVQCELNTVLLPRPPIEFVKHCIICEPAGSKGSRTCDQSGAVDTTGARSARPRPLAGRAGRRDARPALPARLIRFHSPNPLKIHAARPITSSLSVPELLYSIYYKFWAKIVVNSEE